jgi:transglutaminase-like putative cysteine protease
MNRTLARRWDFASAAFVFLIMLTCSQRLFSTRWAHGLGTSVMLALLGAMLGLALGNSTFKRGSVFWLTFGYSIPVTILVLGWLYYDGIPWLERLADLGDRLVYSMVLLLAGRQVHDNALFVVAMAATFWVIGLMAGFSVSRHENIIGAAVPAGIALMIIQFYDPTKTSNDTVMLIFLLLFLLLLGRLILIKRQRLWKESHVHLLAESRTDLNFSMAVVAIVAILLVWSAPTSAKSLRSIKDVWERLTHPLTSVREQLSHAVAGLEAAAPPQPPVEYYGDVLSLGRQTKTGANTFFRVEVPAGNSTMRFYWRVRSYGIFTNEQWQSENPSRMPFVPDKTLVLLPDPHGESEEFVFSVLSNSLAALVTPPHPTWVSVPAELVFLPGVLDTMDPIQFRFNETILIGGEYKVYARVYEPTILQLRQAGEAYPDWVTGHYLQLPDNLSLEIAALAERITEGAGTPYDRAVAVTDYLRRYITYSETVEDPPTGRDPLDWFLFDSRKGFCNYYATAEVILLRVLGIPARLVVGFAQGELEAPNQYLVRQQDSHAWPEAYFPGIGWVEFEPTTSQTPILRPMGEEAPPSEENAEEDIKHAGQEGLDDVTPTAPAKTGLVFWSRLQESPFIRQLLRLFLVFAILDAGLRLYVLGAFTNILSLRSFSSPQPLAVLLKQFFESRALPPPGWLLNWAHLAEMDPMERSFASIYRCLKWLGGKPCAACTPAEAAAALAEQIPGVSNEIQLLLGQYQHHIYGRVRGYVPAAHRTARAIRKEARHVAIGRRWRAFGSILKRSPKSGQA